MSSQRCFGIGASLVLLAGLTFAGAGFSPVAFAEGARSDGPCMADRKALCKETKGQWRKCLSENIGKVSQGCKDHLASKTKGKVAGIKAGCTTDIAAKCPTQAFGGGLKKCLKEHYDSLSQDCKASVDGAKGGN